jgi:hypothetical protein
MLLCDLVYFLSPVHTPRIRYLTASVLACTKVTCGRHGEQSGKRAGRMWSTKMTVTQMWNVNRKTSILGPVARRNNLRRALRSREQKILQQQRSPHLWVRCRLQRCGRRCERSSEWNALFPVMVMWLAIATGTIKVYLREWGTRV